MMIGVAAMVVFEMSLPDGWNMTMHANQTAVVRNGPPGSVCGMYDYVEIMLINATSGCYRPGNDFNSTECAFNASSRVIVNVPSKTSILTFVATNQSYGVHVVFEPDDGIFLLLALAIPITFASCVFVMTAWCTSDKHEFD